MCWVSQGYFGLVCKYYYTDIVKVLLHIADLGHNAVLVRFKCITGTQFPLVLLGGWCQSCFDHKSIWLYFNIGTAYKHIITININLEKANYYINYLLWKLSLLSTGAGLDLCTLAREISCQYICLGSISL